MGSRISNFEWWLILAAIACIDIVQLILDILIAGVVANRIIDLVVGFGLLAYFWMRGVKVDAKLIGLLVVSLFVEEVPLLDAAPAWTFDVWKVRGWDKAAKQAHEAQLAAEAEEEEQEAIVESQVGEEGADTNARSNEPADGSAQQRKKRRQNPALELRNQKGLQPSANELDLRRNNDLAA